MLTYLRIVYYLSLPVVIGAVLSNRMAARLSDVEPIHWATPLVLAPSVFIIYTVDRLFDIQKYDGKEGVFLTPRHQFHQQHALLLWRTVAGAAGLALILSLFLPGSVIKFGLVLGGLCAAYVGAVFRLPARHPALLLKEPLVALFYATGVWGSVWVQRPTVHGIEVAEWLMFIGIAFQNLLLFAVMEQRETLLPPGSDTSRSGVTRSGVPRSVAPVEPASRPARSNQPFFSLATAWGEDRCDLILRWLTFGVIAAGFALCFTTSDRFAQRSALIMALMSLALYGIQRYPAYFLKNERYRWLGDGVFWMPALVL